MPPYERVEASGATAPLSSIGRLEGLSAADVEQRRARGEVNDVSEPPSHTVAQILRANVLTPFNALLGGLLAVILVVGPIQDALFGLVLIANSLTGLVQELRAKRTLDRLTVINAPRARVVRDGTVREVAVEDVVMDDLLELRPGDQVVVDGEVVDADGLEVDESLLTGESEAVEKNEGDAVLSGSFVAAGRGRMRARRVGKKAYARSLAEEARRFKLAHSELRSGLDRIIRLVAWAMLPTAALLFYSQISSQANVRVAVRSTVAGVVAMVPEGLVLLTSVALAVGALRLARRKTLVQELPAVETLARVDTVCLDKTGTLTSGEIAVETIELLAQESDERAVLGALSRLDPDPNATLLAVREASPKVEGWRASAVTPFSSTRKWSGATFERRGTWVLGAPDVLLDDGNGPASSSIRRRVEEQAASGRRVLLLACSNEPSPESGELPRGLEPRALVVLADVLRPDATETIRYFIEQGVAVKIISGDHPRTVSAIAALAGVPDADRALDARRLGEQPEGLESHAVFGRVTPHQKRDMVRALQRRGHVVAMTGDGVNDVLALKDADIGIAMGSGSPASRGAAKLVLLDNSFAALPVAVAEGRRVINNIERVANLFLTKTFYSMALALAIGAASLPFPFLPRHLTLVSSLSIGIPAFLLAFVPNADRARSGFVDRVLRFAVPTGLLAAAATFTAYYVARVRDDVALNEGRTAATIVLLSLGLLVLADLTRGLTRWRGPLIGAMAASFAAVLVVPWLNRFFAVEAPPPMVAVLIVAVVGVTYAAMRLARHAIERWLEPRPDPHPDRSGGPRPTSSAGRRRRAPGDPR
ncbi:MAG TPA: HAD-IC family P-type ATPase [Actinomycetota bacterium]|nr:HAD-IC family P-type ATPase [Actinomycetota bacterium]